MTNGFSKENIARLQKLINYQFNNIDLAREALSHPSLKAHDSKWHKDYERLEMLGDSILGFLITEILFNKYKKSDEGNLAKIKAYLVSKDAICLVAGKINLGNFIIMTHGEEASGGRANPGNIENTMEALLGAIYLDSDIDNVRAVVNTLWSSFLHDFDINQMDPKTSLQEWSQSKKYGMPHYEILSQDGPVHIPKFTVRVSAGPRMEVGSGYSIKNAEKDAAKKLLDKVTIAHFLDE